MTDAIFGPSYEAFFLTTVVGTKLMLRDSLWSKRTKPEKRGILEKRISFWITNTVLPTITYIRQKHEIPAFATEAISDLQVFEKKDRSAVDLHLLMLTGASKQITEVTRKGDMDQEQAGKWLSLMRLTRGSDMFDAASQSVQCSFSRILDNLSGAHQRGQRQDAESSTKYPFFYPKSLYILVAYMVYFYTRSSVPGRVKHVTRFAIDIENKKMLEWEHLSGKLFDKIFKFRSHGLQRTDTEKVDDVHDVHFSVIDLPYKVLHQEIKEKGLPNVTELHRVLMRNMSSKICSIISTSTASFDDDEWYEQQTKVDEWTFLCAQAFENGEVNKKTLQGREKVLKNYILYRSSKKPYKPRCPDKFDRDIFIMGQVSSLYWRHFTQTGRAAQEFMI